MYEKNNAGRRPSGQQLLCVVCVSVYVQCARAREVFTYYNIIYARIIYLFSNNNNIKRRGEKTRPALPVPPAGP